MNKVEIFAKEHAWTIAGICKNIRMIQKGQIVGSNNNISTFENFKMLMAS
ncbi:MAG: hypothetical protein O7C56_02025 [Rickettsia endosymbiont of Ixodes persulcatus]|nr:hypothetical protein [Rickettsia endosymbiont of Ixodes persulcatus]